MLGDLQGKGWLGMLQEEMSDGSGEGAAPLLAPADPALGLDSATEHR